MSAAVSSCSKWPLILETHIASVLPRVPADEEEEEGEEEEEERRGKGRMRMKRRGRVGGGGIGRDRGESNREDITQKRGLAYGTRAETICSATHCIPCGGSAATWAWNTMHPFFR